MRSLLSRSFLSGVARPVGLVLLVLLALLAAGYALLSPASLRAMTLRRPPAAPVVAVAREAAPPAPSVATGVPSMDSIESAGPGTGDSPPPSAGQAVKDEVAVAAPPSWPTVVTGRVLNRHRLPAAGASIVAGGREVRTDVDGRFSLAAPPPGVPLLVKLPGHERVTVPPGPDPVEVNLRPKVVKAAYLTYYGFAERAVRTRVLEALDQTELNALVIDVKGDRGWVLYRTEVPLALAIGAQGPATVRNFDALMADLKSRGIYTIARIVVFKDNVLATARPDLAIIDTRTGQPWKDRETLAWVDPFREEVWEYNIALAEEAVRRGFDEVQFDYVRFPTDGRLSAARYTRPVSRETRVPAIASFLERARTRVGPLGAFVAADIFGYTAFNENDTDIGQRVEELAPHVDYFSPMVYPSGYHLGIPGYRNPVANPYHVVHESVRLIRKRSQGHPVQIRPWLQDFRDYAFDRRVFGPPEVRAQITGSDEAGGIGWMLWNPRNHYTVAALRPKATVATK